MMIMEGINNLPPAVIERRQLGNLELQFLAMGMVITSTATTTIVLARYQ